MYTIGIDIGSMSTNGVLINEKKEISFINHYTNWAPAVKRLRIKFFNRCPQDKLSSATSTISSLPDTGIKVPFANEVVTEITCHK
ncbi:MAG: hypothetical protein IPI25_00050 [Candidatus Brocadia sp.]|nr:MAG: hypothetical protein IPI25_00050 [Candidatus Brocadia sp.]